MNKDIFIKVDSLCFLRVLNERDVSENYVSWLNNYEISKYTQQKFIKHNLNNVEEFVKQKRESSIDLLFGIFYDNIHLKKYGHEYISKIILQNIENELTK